MNILMEIMIFIIDIFSGFLVSYFKKKGENLATKEDIGEITNIVEKIKTNNNLHVEKIKNMMKNRDEIISIRREVYTKMVNSLRIFISGHESDNKHKFNFLSNYSYIWLWANDGIIKEINKFIDMQIIYKNNPGRIPQEKMKNQFTKCLIEMRRDVGFSDTQIKTDDYKFVNFE